MLEIPLDVVHLITKLIGTSSRPLSYTIDAVDLASLHALCLVSRSFNALATPFLYSSIALSSPRMVACLATTAKSKPELLQLCHSLCWQGVRMLFLEDKILSPMTRLKRFASWQTSDPSIDFLHTSTMTELAFPSLPWDILSRSLSHFTFSNLERLVMASITFSNDARTVETFLKMPRLTHVVITALDALHIYPTHLDDMALVIKHASQLRRVTFCLIQEDVRGLDYDGFRNGILDRLPEHRHVKVVFWTRSGNVLYWGDVWLKCRIIDGTLWEMDPSPNCPMVYGVEGY